MNINGKHSGVRLPLADIRSSCDYALPGPQGPCTPSSDKGAVGTPFRVDCTVISIRSGSHSATRCDTPHSANGTPACCSNGGHLERAHQLLRDLWRSSRGRLRRHSGRRRRRRPGAGCIVAAPREAGRHRGHRALGARRVGPLSMLPPQPLQLRLQLACLSDSNQTEADGAGGATQGAAPRPGHG
jgi:hypothetical protein